MPAHWLAEAGTALWAKADIHRQITREEMHARLAYLAGLPVVAAPLARFAAVAGVVSLELGVPLYDTLYLSLAEQLGLPLISADRRLLKRAGDLPRFAGLLVWIGDVALG